jgi:hypothetical protein
METLGQEESWRGRDRRTAASAYALLFLRHVLGTEAQARRSLQLLVETRWAPLRTVSSSSSSSSSCVCHRHPNALPN